VGWTGLGLIFASGLLYSAGALIYALQRPDPFPATFGYHELFHVLTIAASACNFVMMARLLAVAV
jgi:hemolysin III